MCVSVWTNEGFSAQEAIWNVTLHYHLVEVCVRGVDNILGAYTIGDSFGFSQIIVFCRFCVMVLTIFSHSSVSRWCEDYSFIFTNFDEYKVRKSVRLVHGTLPCL